MRTETITKTYAFFHELTEEQKAQAIEKNRDWNVDFDGWWDACYEDIKRVGALFGIEIADIEFTGFWSQGDGARFKGRWERPKRAVSKAVREYAPNDDELHELANLLDRYRRREHPTACEIWYAHWANYCHEGLTSFEWEYGPKYQAGTELAEEVLRNVFRRLMKWAYSQLEKEYEWLRSDEAVAESLKANEVEFDLDELT
jgi:hypothetical protein